MAEAGDVDGKKKTNILAKWVGAIACNNLCGLCLTGF